MKQLITTICFLLAVVVVSAQKDEHYKNKRPDQHWNEYISHGGFGWGPTTVDGKITNRTGFLNFTDEVLEVRLRIPAIGVDTVYTVPPAMHESDSYWFILGYDLIPFEGWLINPMMIECSVNQPGYNFTLRYTWFRGAKRHF